MTPTKGIDAEELVPLTPRPLPGPDKAALAAQAERILAERRVNAGAIASRLWRLRVSIREAFDRDARFDGGEFSGPSLGYAWRWRQREILREAGLTPDQWNALLEARLGPKAAYWSGLEVDPEPPRGPVWQ